jgi:hypothetical protein
VTDYTRVTGSGPGATMLIRDTGSTVEFWINSNNSTTWTDHLPWSWSTAYGSGGGSYYYHPGSQWQRLGSISVTSSTNVTFSIGATGTQGFGGPTSFTVNINRATVPPAPNAVGFSSITSTSVHAVFTGNGDGGSTITAWQTGYGTDPSIPQTIVDTYDEVISGLTPGTTYYFWARGVNAVGNGLWSVRSQFTTLQVPDATTTPVISEIGPVSVKVTFSPNGDGGSAITGFEVGYGTDSSTPTTVVSATSPQTISGLTPGTTYYFWARAINSVGPGSWSTVTSTTTIAGARINVGGIWKVAVPYVRDSGVWKKATPWVKSMGEWKETI